jgi:hypothetical protein
MARYAKFFSLGSGGGGTNNLQLPVGTILDATLRQVQDGTGTGSPLYLSTRRVGITSDSSVTTQTSSVIQASTTNANLVIAPNGTGALVAQIPDGTATGGNARGANAVDLQMSRSAANQVASSNNSTIAGGVNNRAFGIGVFIGGGDSNSAGGADNYQAIAGGRNNSITTGGGAFIGGGEFNSINSGGNGFNVIAGGRNNTVTSAWSTISGGQSNTVSTNTHATVVGGQSNTSSGAHSITGGNTNVASDTQSISIGGQSNNVTERYSASLGGLSNAVNGRYNANISGQGNIVGRFNSNGNIALAGLDNRVCNTAGQYSVAQGFRNTVNATNSGAFGRDNLVVGDSSYAFGSGNQINKSYAFAIGNGTSYMASMFSHGNGVGLDNPFLFSAQSSEVLATNQQTVSSGGTITLFLDGATGTETIQPNNKPVSSRTVYNTFAKWVAIVQTVTGTTDVAVGDVITSVQTFAWKDNVGVSSLVGAVTTISTSSDLGMATASMSYTIGASQELVCTFTAPIFTGVGATVRFKVLNVLQFAEVTLQN